MTQQLSRDIPQHAGVNTDVYLQEYARDDIIAQYVARSAGAGIAYVLENVYAPVYLKIIRALISSAPRDRHFRLLEYGCGGGT